jgi:hypothetical protein
MKCPRYYEYIHIHGWSSSKVDLEFGIFAAAAFETFQKARLRGASLDQATVVALRKVLEETWDTETGPWGGSIETQWRCTGTEKFKNDKGHAAKCPYSHKGAFFPVPAPAVCGKCGSAIETVRHYIPNHQTKNRDTLARLVVWYCLDQPENMADGLHPYVFPDGTAAVELSFALPLPWTNRHGETYILAGHLDQIGEFGDELWTVDEKTTTKGLDAGFWGGYSPHVQFDTYDMVGKMLFPTLNLKGVLLDGAQTLVGGTRFGRHMYAKTDGMREEHMEMIKFWIDQAERYAEAGYWPMNKTACYLCPFKKICSMDPKERERYLNADFQKREPWDPLKAR